MAMGGLPVPRPDPVPALAGVSGSIGTDHLDQVDGSASPESLGTALWLTQWQWVEVVTATALPLALPQCQCRQWWVYQLTKLRHKFKLLTTYVSNVTLLFHGLVKIQSDLHYLFFIIYVSSQVTSVLFSQNQWVSPRHVLFWFASASLLMVCLHSFLETRGRHLARAVAMEYGRFEM